MMILTAPTSAPSTATYKTSLVCCRRRGRRPTWATQLSVAPLAWFEDPVDLRGGSGGYYLIVGSLGARWSWGAVVRQLWCPERASLAPTVAGGAVVVVAEAAGCAVVSAWVGSGCGSSLQAGNDITAMIARIQSERSLLARLWLTEELI